MTWSSDHILIRASLHYFIWPLDNFSTAELRFEVQMCADCFAFYCLLLSMMQCLLVQSLSLVYNLVPFGFTSKEQRSWFGRTRVDLFEPHQSLNAFLYESEGTGLSWTCWNIFFMPPSPAVSCLSPSHLFSSSSSPSWMLEQEQHVGRAISSQSGTYWTGRPPRRKMSPNCSRHSL